MTRKEKFDFLEEECQKRYLLIDKYNNAIEHARNELEDLEVRYLKAKDALSKVSNRVVERQSKLDKIKSQLIKLGVEDIDSLILSK